MLGAGEGWAKTILYHDGVRRMFEEFFARSDAFALGVCNGCQMLAALKELIPGTQAWPKFLRNRSDQFEARVSLVEIVPSPSVLLAGMAGSRLPIVTAHGEGRAEFAVGERPRGLRRAAHGAALRDERGRRSRATYPANPNGSPHGIAGLCERRRPRHDHDAAPGARVPHRAALVAPARVGRVLAVAAPVRQRAHLGRLAPPVSSASGCRPLAVMRSAAA